MCTKPSERFVSFLTMITLALVISGCGLLSDDEPVIELPDWSEGSDLELRSDAFADGEPIPVEYTCNGDDISPPLEWDEAPGETATLTLIMDDPDAPDGIFTHWLIYELPPDTTSLTAGIEPVEEVAGNVRQGENDFGEIGYRGPCPPLGEGHSYRFTLYALDSGVDFVEPGANREEVIEAIEGHVIAGSQLVGVYERSSD